MEEYKTENNVEIKSKDSQKQIAAAIIIAGIIIAGAILLKGSGGGAVPKANATISKMIGLNVKSFNACLASGKFKDKIQADIDDGVRAGVNGTPSSFILKDGKVFSFIGADGKMFDAIPGAQPYDTINENIERILKNDTKSIEKQIKPVSSDDHILGNINARIVIIEYSDLECPFCKVFHNTMHQVVEKSNGDVAWIYRHYPIPQLHPKAFHEAEATECAWEQGGNKTFWKYIDKLFEVTPSNNGLPESQL